LNFRRLTWLTFLALLASPGFAAEGPVEEKESNWRLGAAMGYGIRSNPLVQSDDIPIVVDLDIAWFGERWFFDNGDLGFTFADNHALTASVVARVNSDRVFFGKTDTRFVNVDLTGLPLSEVVDFKPPSRDYAIELGAEVLAGGNWGALQFSAFHDVSGTHEGFELYADYSFGWRQQRLYIEPSFGLSYKSADLNNYYWGITPDEAGLVAFPYEADAGLNYHARFMLAYQLNRRWAVSLVTEYERLNDEAAASPIVEDDTVLGWFAGISYRFGR
jgi:outer membrane protein